MSCIPTNSVVQNNVVTIGLNWFRACAITCILDPAPAQRAFMVAAAAIRFFSEQQKDPWHVQSKQNEGYDTIRCIWHTISWAEGSNFRHLVVGWLAARFSVVRSAAIFISVAVLVAAIFFYFCFVSSLFLFSATEIPLPLRVPVQRIFPFVLPSKIRPQDLADKELGVGRFP